MRNFSSRPIGSYGKVLKIINFRSTSRAETHAKHSTNTPKHGRNLAETQPKPKNTLEHTLEHTLETHQKHTRNSLETLQKHTRNTLETHQKHSRNTVKHSRNLAETQPKHCQNCPKSARGSKLSFLESNQSPKPPQGRQRLKIITFGLKFKRILVLENVPEFFGNFRGVGKRELPSHRNRWKNVKNA